LFDAGVDESVKVLTGALSLTILESRVLFAEEVADADRLN
jgi:hypothetical protein